MPPQLDALIALADELYKHGNQRETLKIIENIYALYDLGHVDKRSDPEPGGGNIEETREVAAHRATGSSFDVPSGAIPQ
ncbi:MULTISPECIES: hypothetical protein [Gluconobacter]|uniref:hypothetical protein n=1 Tax=Gluconobacter TaxID=441 RepID=UPI001B8CAE80|nr:MULTISPECIES: hypothetical protein [Gluconobacter]MBS0994404.1 hypothetical protein [Gluconobacter cerinus]MBS1022110.1 hypothetical protein [Gluconobacter cerinus]MBS1035219.1 hypothetical protein [Gluconobacter cerinus]